MVSKMQYWLWVTYSSTEEGEEVKLFDKLLLRLKTALV